MSFKRVALALSVSLIGALSMAFVVVSDDPGDAALAATPDLTTTTRADTTTTLETTTTTAPSTTTTAPPTTTTTTTAPSTTTTAPPTTTTTTSAPTTTAAPSPPTTAAPTTTTTTTRGGSFAAGAENDFAGRINSLRADNGLDGLSRNGSLDSYARDWSKKMGENASLDHSNFGSLLGPWSSVGENIAVGDSVGAMFSGLAGSSGHLGNMIGDFTHLGVGVWEDADGRLWTTHVFTR